MLAFLLNRSYDLTPVILIADDVPHLRTGTQDIVRTGGEDDVPDLREGVPLELVFERGRHHGVDVDELEGVEVGKQLEASDERREDGGDGATGNADGKDSVARR